MSALPEERLELVPPTENPRAQHRVTASSRCSKSADVRPSRRRCSN
jgi:hypothetical protein